MEAIYTALAVCSGVAILLIGVSIPMYSGKIKRNKYYGFRTPKTLSSDEIWYQVNHDSGLYMIVAGIVILLTACGLFFLKSMLATPVLVGIMIVISIVSLVGAVVKSFMSLSRY